jgi:hypothetical protein
MSKTHKCTVVKAFVHGGRIRMPKTSIVLSVAEAKPLLEAGKVVLAASARLDDADDTPVAKVAVKSGKKAGAKDDDKTEKAGAKDDDKTAKD